MMRPHTLLDAVRDGVTLLRTAIVAVPAATVGVCLLIGWQTVQSFEVFIIASICMLTFGTFGILGGHSIDPRLNDRSESPLGVGNEPKRLHRLYPGPAFGFMLLSVVVAGILFAIGWGMLRFAA